MSKYKPMLISFDAEGYKQESKRASEKLSILNSAIDWMEANSVNLLGEGLNEVMVSSIDKSFCEFYTNKVWEQNKHKIQLEITKEKLLDLMGINITELKRMEIQYHQIESQQLEFYPVYDDSKTIEFNYRFPVDRKSFERYTKSSEENAKLRAFREFTAALDKLSEHCHVYPNQIQLATSGFVKFDIRTGEYFPFI